QIGPAVLEHARLDAEPARDRVREIDFETDDLRRVARILPHVGLAALDVSAPGQLAALLDLCQGAAVLISTRSQSHEDDKRTTHGLSMQQITSLRALAGAVASSASEDARASRVRRAGSRAP